MNQPVESGTCTSNQEQDNVMVDEHHSISKSGMDIDNPEGGPRETPTEIKIDNPKGGPRETPTGIKIDNPKAGSRETRPPIKIDNPKGGPPK